MLTIQRNYWKDLPCAKEKIVFSKGKNPNASQLYRAIAGYLGIYTSDIPLAQTRADQNVEVAAICDRIDAKNLELACVGVEPKKPVLVCPMQRPKVGEFNTAIVRPKSVVKPVVRKLPPASVMAKALARGGLVIIR